MGTSNVVSVYCTRSPKKDEIARYLPKYPGWKAGVLSVHYLSNKAQMREEMETNCRRISFRAVKEKLSHFSTFLVERY